MKRLSLIGCLAAAMLMAATGLAQQPEKEAELPVKRIVLFSSGVGYFQHNGQVDGNAAARLDFRAGQINDILKSLVLMDLGGGSVSTVTYDSMVPVERKLQSFEVNVIGNPSLYELLLQLRGAAVTVEAPNKVTGVILGVESHTRKLVPTGDVVTVQSVNLLTPAGIRSIPLESIINLSFNDPKLRAELDKAMAALAEGRDKGRKPITIRFAGDGARRVHVSYVIETPVWKTSYRLVMPQDDQKPMLQGWAIVENTTETDWTGVELSLVSGRPISFVMDLYTPMFVPRPEVQPELYAGLVAPVYAEGMDEMGNLATLRQESKKAKELAEAARGYGQMDKDQLQRNRRAAPPAQPGMAVPRDGKLADEKLDFASGVVSAATAQKLGALFSYDIQSPVTVARQQSAMLPIVQGEITVDPVSIYNQSVQAKHPLAGMVLTNTTGAHLMAGPMTVFEMNTYAGDARIDDMPAGDKRLVSYAVDLDVTVDPSYDRSTDSITAVKVVRGVLEATHKYVSKRTYAIKNKADKTKTVLIEHPFKGGWDLVEPKEFEEKTSSVYRFRVPVEKNTAGKFDVEEQRIASQTVALLNVDHSTFLYYAGLDATSPKVKEALREAASRRQRMAEVASQLSHARRRLQQNRSEQERVLKFVEKLKEGTQIHQEYLKDLQRLKTAADGFEKQVGELDAEHEKLQKQFRDFLQGLNLE